MSNEQRQRLGPVSRRQVLSGGAALLAVGVAGAATAAEKAPPAAARPAADAGTRPARAAAPGVLLTRPIPSSGEALPVVGLGTNAYSVTDAAEVAKREAVVARLVELGGKVIDTARAYGDSELVVAGIVQRLKARDRVFLATKTPIQGELGDPAAVAAETFRRVGADVIDLLQVHNLHGTAELMPTLQRLKAERRVRYIGATSSRDEQYPAMLAAMRDHPLDFVQIDYSIANRSAAAEVLPLAVTRKIGVLVNMPFGGRRDGNLLRRLGDRPLPPWAADLDAGSWAEVLLKYVLSHPAVTCAIPGTTSVQNLETNLRAARGPLPDEALRRRMEEYWDALKI
jgi:aryl-alcohol dehydrogenase-like predicted oxidoreductase